MSGPHLASHFRSFRSLMPSRSIPRSQIPRRPFHSTSLRGATLGSHEIQQAPGVLDRSTLQQEHIRASPYRELCFILGHPSSPTHPPTLRDLSGKGPSPGATLSPTARKAQRTLKRLDAILVRSEGSLKAMEAQRRSLQQELDLIRSLRRRTQSSSPKKYNASEPKKTPCRTDNSD
ncbi:hypothetical protein BJ684DRAFT_19476 [Piptocephalis cylindrospora]|uniref:Uncharacterized protein n=1 Tax=Piptocephalis cylindrospora TaxID=1907219 RepID=A0A4P9Y513_9FUNG|nr:hypothetical protein BJ684DRAFT_19476 [Piptocephalis cylindrospora]|eukprot:RKP14088.1 hypothetical protein BJ684DRAFT_19476 [Piptocephalis cylindrospora]